MHDFFFQPFQIMATDLGKNPKVSKTPAKVTVNVQRNDVAPVFEKDDYSKNINRDEDAGESLIRVRARDSDDKVCDGNFC